MADKEVRTDENFVDDEGNPRADALIFEDYILCHPDLKEKLETALKLFFTKASES